MQLWETNLLGPFHIHDTRLPELSRTVAFRSPESRSDSDAAHHDEQRQGFTHGEINLPSFRSFKPGS